MRKPVRDLAEMRKLLGQWAMQSSQSPLPQRLWAVEAADDGQLLGGAPLLPFGPGDPQLVMGWHLRPKARGRGVAGQVGHALAHQAFLASYVNEVFVAAPARNAGSIAVARRLGMTTVDDFMAAYDWYCGRAGPTSTRSDLETRWTTPMTQMVWTTGELDDGARRDVLCALV
jgi:RimJ/RimL family protein N-acetyltransferase